MKALRPLLTSACVLALAGAAVAANPTYAWRYYRPGNTGMQGDFCDAIWFAPDGDPWIAGHAPSFEEGGIAKFVQAENRWINISNVDYPVIGHPNNTGVARVSDIVADAQGTLWMATGIGALRFNPTQGPSSLARFDAGNSAFPGGWNRDVDIAPDGTIWFASYATTWGGGGITRYRPTQNAWNAWPNLGDAHLSVQPKPGGGYWVWAPGPAGCQRFDSATGAWANLGQGIGTPGGLPSSHATDASGNTWMFRITSTSMQSTLDCRRPNGTWVGVPLPVLPAVNPPIWAFKAFGNLQALLVDGNNTTWRFNGTSWSDLGQWRPGAFSSFVDIDPAGNVWVGGTGGVAKRDATTGLWQRHRLSNNGQLDYFSEDLALDPVSGRVWACANGAPGVGGIESFDGVRWTLFNNSTYGLGNPWPFPTDNAQAIYVRPSNRALVVNPTFDGTSSYDGSTWTSLPGGSGKVIGYVEDSTGRLWQLGEYMNLAHWTGSSWTNVGILSWGQTIQRDPDRPGTVWANAGYEVARTDGTYRFSRTIDDIAELTSQSDTFSGLAVGPGGVAWVGCSVMLGAGGTGGGLVRFDASAGTYTLLRYDQGWPFPGNFVSPLAVTPDGRVWMTYDTPYPYTQRGLLWWDGTTVQTFPAPPGGEPQWGGMPHAQLNDFEVKPTANGYELWMSCASRGLAVLTVTLPCAVDFNGDGVRNPNDIFAFLNAYFARENRADFNRDGSLTPADLFAFLNAYFAGC